jgi:hypothetical protein
MGNSLFVFVKENRLATRLVLLLFVIILTLSGLIPILNGTASAAGQLTARSLTLSSGVPSATGVQYKFTFTVQATSTLQSMKIQFCTRPTSTCLGTAGTTVPNVSSAAWVSQNSWQGAVNFATGGGSNDCTASSTVICATRSSGTSQTATSRDITFGTIINPSTPNTAFYARITTYSDSAYTLANIQDTGATAAAVVQTLQVNAQVAEVLNFCVGSTTVDSDSSGSPGADCTNIAGTSVNLGTLDSSKINITPETTDCTPADCGKNGVAMVRSNALNGTVIYYDSVQQSGSNHKGTLRINGQNCNATADNASSDTADNTDQCFNVRSTQAAFTTTAERFGMTVAGVNCGSTISYTCTGTGGANPANLVRNAAYDCDGTATYPVSGGVGDIDQVNGPTTCGYAWDESGAATQIAASTSSSVKQIDDEALIMKFAAHPLITTPFGSYQAQTDFIAVSTY